MLLKSSEIVQKNFKYFKYKLPKVKVTKFGPFGPIWGGPILGKIGFITTFMQFPNNQQI